MSNVIIRNVTKEQQELLLNMLTKHDGSGHMNLGKADHIEYTNNGMSITMRGGNDNG